MSLHKIASGTARAEITKKVLQQTPYGSSYYRRERIGEQIGEVALFIDPDKILKALGAQALNNKSGKACRLRGALVMKVMRREEIIDPPRREHE